jgi:hypothetical protein
LCGLSLCYGCLVCQVYHEANTTGIIYP